MNRVLKTISLLLSYPTQELLDECPALVAALQKENLSAPHLSRLSKLAKNIGSMDLYDVQERFVFLFDRTRTLSLHLFEHVHGESRDRGQAMVDLRDMYEAQGFLIDAKEMPDYLPLFLEYLSTLPQDEVTEMLGQTKHILTVLRERLKKRKSIYLNAFVVLEAIAAGKVERKLVEELLGQPDHDPDDLEALDRIWEEEAVSFGGNAGENVCGPDRMQRQMRAHQRPPADTKQNRNSLEG